MPRKLLVAEMASRPDKRPDATSVIRIVPRKLADQSGFTLVEVMVAVLILVAGILGTLSLLDGANAATSRTKTREAATNLARELIESARAVPYPKLTTPEITTAMQDQPGLDDVNGATGWQIRRRNVLFTVTPIACSVDDSTATGDGLGDHTDGYFCSDSSAQGTTDSNPDDYKRLSFDVTWMDGSTVRKVRQEAVINNPGAALAPGIRTLTMTNPTVDPITNPSVSTIAFEATTTSVPVVVRWSVGNVPQGDATGSNFTWNFTWNIASVDDGTYLIGARAFDKFGESGTTRSRTVVLNRFAPRTPAGFVAGRNGAIGVEFEWVPNTEPDVSGYRVYRVTGAAPSAADVVVCSTRTTDRLPTTCRDKDADAAPAELHYYVVAVAPARGATGDEESPRPTTLAQTGAVSNSNIPPNPPADLTATASGDGTITLTWPNPDSPPAGESDDTVRYYRIYRDGELYADRYDRTGSATDMTFVDTDPGPGTHTYSVTTVDSQLAESVHVTVQNVGL
jgi:prepilin-type N-terminal cleavage/methylation domain-containing protein